MAVSAKKGFVGIHVMVFFIFFSAIIMGIIVLFLNATDVNFSTTYGLYVW